MNNFDNLTIYEKVNEKPDKKYSMLPTMLFLLDLNKDNNVIDIGCGTGFFTFPISQIVKHVIGIDNSVNQIKNAVSAPNILYLHKDMLNFEYPICDRISCPFVLNYIQPIDELTVLFRLFKRSIKYGGKLVSIVDRPNSIFHDSREFGAIKKVKEGTLKEGSLLEIELYNNNQPILKLESFYHTKETLEDCAIKAGFKNIYWAEPIISQEGINLKGKEYWERYKRNLDIAYLVAEK